MSTNLSERPYEVRKVGAPPAPEPEPELRPQSSVEERVKALKPKESWLSRAPRLLSWVVLLVPTIVTALYLYIWSSDIYVTDTTFAIRRAGESDSLGSNSFFARAFAGLTNAGDESFSIVEFVRSREAMRMLNATFDLRQQWSASDIDPWNRLSSTASEEDLYSYYRSMIDIQYNEVTNLITLETRGFTPELSHAMADLLQQASEQLVNEFNARAEEDLLALLQQEVLQAEQMLEQAQRALTRFRIENQAIDPASVGTMIGTILTNLQSEAALTKANIRELSNYSQTDTPQMREAKNRLAALEAQIAEEQERLTGTNNALAEKIEEYSTLVLHEELARRALTSALAAREETLATARRQQLYVVNVVPAKQQLEARLPNRPETILFVFLGSIVGWIAIRLISAAIRDHAL